MATKSPDVRDKDYPDQLIKPGQVPPVEPPGQSKSEDKNIDRERRGSGAGIQREQRGKQGPNRER